MKSIALGLLAALLTSQQAFAWGAVAGPYGGAAYRGQYSAGVRTPSGAAAVRGPEGNVAVRGPTTYGYGYHPPTTYAYGYHPPAYGYPAGCCRSGRRCRSSNRHGCRCSSNSRSTAILSTALLYAILSLTTDDG